MRKGPKMQSNCARLPRKAFLQCVPSRPAHKVNGLGGINEGALVMEFLDGTEYVVDSVSRDGVHRICAIWEYDKRRVNEANFVYFGMELRPATGKVKHYIYHSAFNSFVFVYWLHSIESAVCSRFYLGSFVCVK